MRRQILRRLQFLQFRYQRRNPRPKHRPDRLTARVRPLPVTRSAVRRRRALAVRLVGAYHDATKRCRDSRMQLDASDGIAP